MEGSLDAVVTTAGLFWDQIVKCVSTITYYPILLIPVGIFVVGAGIGLAKRLIGR